MQVLSNLAAEGPLSKQQLSLQNTTDFLSFSQIQIHALTLPIHHLSFSL